jgi:hypothetical protein
MTSTQLLGPGVYRIAEADYHADPCKTPSASSSILKIMDTHSPRHAMTAHPRLNKHYAPMVATKFDLGTAGHALILGDETDFAILEYADYKKTAARAERDDARAQGIIPILSHQWDEVRRMADAVIPQLEAHELGNFLVGATPTMTLVFETQGVLCRTLLDWHPPEPETALVWGDLKTTSDGANPDNVWRRLVGTGADLQNAMHRRAVHAHYGDGNRRFVNLMVETTVPYAVSVVEFNAAARALADHRLDRALHRWRHCLANNRWPGYSSHVVEVEPPPWAETDMVAREQREAVAAADGRDLLKEMMDWQAPNVTERQLSEAVEKGADA